MIHTFPGEPAASEYVLEFTWGMMVSFSRRSWSPMEAMSTPSIVIWPPAASRILKRQFVRDDFPAPVRPTTPICKYSFLHVSSSCNSWGQQLSLGHSYSEVETHLWVSILILTASLKMLDWLWFWWEEKKVPRCQKRMAFPPYPLTCSWLTATLTTGNVHICCYNYSWKLIDF